MRLYRPFAALLSLFLGCLFAASAAAVPISQDISFTLSDFDGPLAGSTIEGAFSYNADLPTDSAGEVAVTPASASLTLPGIGVFDETDTGVLVRHDGMGMPRVVVFGGLQNLVDQIVGTTNDFFLSLGMPDTFFEGSHDFRYTADGVSGIFQAGTIDVDGLGGTTPVPEPSSLLLIALGLAGLACRPATRALSAKAKSEQKGSGTKSVSVTRRKTAFIGDKAVVLPRMDCTVGWPRGVVNQIGFRL